MKRLEGKIAIVTGASRGIGEAIATAFAREGAHVVIASRKKQALDEVAARINAEYPDAVSTQACHMGDSQQVETLIDCVTTTYGVPNVIVNNAGTNPYFGPFVGAQRDAWEKTFDVNLRGAFELSRAAATRMMAAGVRGSIINVASVLGMGAAPMQGVYGMTKAALISMTQTMALELGGAGIRVNAIAPGLVNTKLAAALVHNDDLVKYFTDRAALRRYAEPEELAGPALFLASDESSYVTGHTLVVDGGFLTS